VILPWPHTLETRETLAALLEEATDNLARDRAAGYATAPPTKPIGKVDLLLSACSLPLYTNPTKRIALYSLRAAGVFDTRVVMAKASPLGRAVLRQDAGAAKCRLTFELRGRPTVGHQARATENERTRPVARAWWHAVGPPLE
jgi:hypothetical protein